MAEKKLRFLVVFFSKNRRLILTLAALAAIVAAVWLIVAFTNWLVTVNQDETLPWTTVYEDEGWQGTPSANLPKYFVAGGTTFDKEILVDGWGLQVDALQSVDYMEDLGVHILFGDVTKITYGENMLQISIEEKEQGYKLITVDKANLTEGDLQIVFVDSQGVPLNSEQEYVYSIPLDYTLVDAGEAGGKGAVFMEELDTDTLPVLTGLDISLLDQHSNSVLLYIEGGEVATIQRNENTLRVYTDSGPVYQVISLNRSQLLPGQNIIRLIDSSDLSVKSQIIVPISAE